MLKLLVNKLNKYQLKQLLLIYAGLIVLAIPTILIPLFSSGFIGDDTLSSLIQGSMKLNNQSIVDQYLENFNNMKGSRLALLPIYYFLFLIIGGEVIYLKIWVSLIVIALIFSIIYFHQYFKIEKKFSILSALVFIGFLQYRDYGDPILAFYGLTPLSILVLLLSIVSIHKILNENNSFIKLAIFNALIIFTGQLYEYNIIILALSFIALLKGINDKKIKIIKHLSPTIIFYLFYFIALFYFRNFHDNINPEFQEAYNPSKNYLLILKTAAIQLISSLPFSNFIFDKVTYNFGTNQVLIGIILFLIYFTLLLFLVNKFSTYFPFQEKENKKIKFEKFSLVLISIYIIIIPTLLISLSPKYQIETNAGSPYTNSLYFIVGLSIFIGIICSYLKKIIYLLLFLVALSYGLNYIGNQDTVEKINEFWDTPRATAVAAMKNGIFSEIPSEPVILSSINYPWSIAPFYNLYGNIIPNQLFYQGTPGVILSPVKDKINFLSGAKIVSVPDNHDLLSDFPYLKNNLKFFDGIYYHFDFSEKNSNIYYLNYINNNKNSSAISLCRVRKLIANQDNFLSVLCDDFIIFSKGKSTFKKDTRKLNFVVDAYDLESGKKIGNYIIDDSAFLVKKNRNSTLAIYKRKEQGILIDGKAINLNIENPFINKSFHIPTDFYNDLKSSATDLNKSSIILKPINKEISTEISLKFSLDSTLNAFQPEFAHIIGNHPGAGFQGFVFQKKHMSKNIYEFTFGTGKDWISLGSIKIDDNKLHNLNIKINRGFIDVFFDGDLVGSSDSFLNSNLPIQVGGLIGGGRNFIGKVYSVKIEN